MPLLFTLTLTVLLQKNTRLFFFLCCCSFYFFDTECSPYNMLLWTDDTAPFPFGKDGSGVIANCFLCGTEATLFFSAGPVAQVFPLKPAPFCMFFTGLGSTNTSSISLLFSYYLILVLSSPLCPLLYLSFYLNLWQELSSLTSCSIRLQWVPRPSLFLGNDSADQRARRGVLLVQQFVVVSLLISLVSTLLFSRTGGMLSHLNCSTHRFPRFPPRNLCIYVMLAVFSLAFAATDTVFC